MNSCHRNKIESEEMPSISIKRIIDILPDNLKPNDAIENHNANHSTKTSNVLATALATYLTNIKNNDTDALEKLKTTNPTDLQYALIAAINIPNEKAREIFITSIIQLSKRRFRFEAMVGNEYLEVDFSDLDPYRRETEQVSPYERRQRDKIDEYMKFCLGVIVGGGVDLGNDTDIDKLSAMATINDDEDLFAPEFTDSRKNNGYNTCTWIELIINNKNENLKSFIQTAKEYKQQIGKLKQLVTGAKDNVLNPDEVETLVNQLEDIMLSLESLRDRILTTHKSSHSGNGSGASHAQLSRADFAECAAPDNTQNTSNKIIKCLVFSFFPCKEIDYLIINLLHTADHEALISTIDSYPVTDNYSFNKKSFAIQTMKDRILRTQDKDYLSTKIISIEQKLQPSKNLLNLRKELCGKIKASPNHYPTLGVIQHITHEAIYCEDKTTLLTLYKRLLALDNSDKVSRLPAKSPIKQSMITAKSCLFAKLNINPQKTKLTNPQQTSLMDKLITYYKSDKKTGGLFYQDKKTLDAKKLLALNLLTIFDQDLSGLTENELQEKYNNFSSLDRQAKNGKVNSKSSLREYFKDANDLLARHLLLKRHNNACPQQIELMVKIYNYLDGKQPTNWDPDQTNELTQIIGNDLSGLTEDELQDKYKKFLSLVKKAQTPINSNPGLQECFDEVNDLFARHIDQRQACLIGNELIANGLPQKETNVLSKNWVAKGDFNLTPKRKHNQNKAVKRMLNEAGCGNSPAMYLIKLAEQSKHPRHKEIVQDLQDLSETAYWVDFKQKLITKVSESATIITKSTAELNAIVELTKLCGSHDRPEARILGKLKALKKQIEDLRKTTFLRKNILPKNGFADEIIHLALQSIQKEIKLSTILPAESLLGEDYQQQKLDAEAGAGAGAQEATMTPSSAPLPSGPEQYIPDEELQKDKLDAGAGAGAQEATMALPSAPPLPSRQEEYIPVAAGPYTPGPTAHQLSHPTASGMTAKEGAAAAEAAVRKGKTIHKALNQRPKKTIRTGNTKTGKGDQHTSTGATGANSTTQTATAAHSSVFGVVFPPVPSHTVRSTNTNPQSETPQQQQQDGQPTTALPV